MVDAHQLHRGLSRIRKARRRVWLLLLTLVPASVAVEMATQSHRAAACVSLCWVGGWIAALWALGLCECPRCGNWYHARCKGVFGRYSNPFTRKCLSCGLSIRADRESSEIS